MPVTMPDKPYLVDNNQQLDMQALEQRLDELLAEQQPLPAALAPLPSLQPAASPSLLRRLVIRLRSSRLVSHWLPRHPRLYRRARALYHWLRGLVRRR